MQQIAHRISKLLENRFSFSVLTTDSTPSNDDYEGVSVERRRAWFTLKSLPIAPSYFFRLYQQRQQFDVLFLHYPFPVLDLFFTLCGKGSARLVVIWHSDIVDQKKLKALVEPFTKVMLKKADLVVVSSPSIRKYSAMLATLPAEKVITAPFPTTLDENSVNLDDIEYQDFILCVGRQVPYKGIDVLLRALAKTEQFAVIIGKGGELKKNIALAEQLGISDRVTFIERAEQDELLEYYRTCKALVLPSTTPNEALGLVQVEAMMYAKPVVNTNLKSGVPWVTEEIGPHLTVEPNNVEALANVLDTLSIGYCKDHGKLYRELAVNKFSSQKCIGNYAKIIEGD